ncbi:MAG: 30S ribosomal protein S20 [Patescibacteria group bacterium]
MPITQSAKKALRQNKRRRARNLTRMRTYKDAIKQAKKTPTSESLARAYQALDKAAKTGVIKKNTASRKKSRLARHVKVEK